MRIILYKNESEPIKVDKTLTQIATVEGYLREETSLLRPSFAIELPSSAIGNINYAYVEEFGRYYFVGNPESIRTGLWLFPMKVDVLSTYKVDIRNNYAIIGRNEKEYDLLLNDGLFQTQQRPRRAQIVFPQGFDTWNFVLAIAGN